MSRIPVAAVLALALLCVVSVDAQTVTRSEMISEDTLDNATATEEKAHDFSQKPDK